MDHQQISEPHYAGGTTPLRSSKAREPQPTTQRLEAFRGHVLRLAFGWMLAVGCAACSDDASMLHDASVAPGPARDGSSGDGPRPSTVEPSAPDSSAADDPCSIEELREPRAATSYYIAIDEPGADNEACDGLAPSDEGGGRCPFKDFDSERTRALLSGVTSTRVELRAGTYVIRGWDGLRVEGTGSNETERMVLSAYEGERPVLDVPRPDGAGCVDMSAVDDPGCVRQVLRVAGAYTQVQGLTIRNGLGYHVEINGGAHHVFRCNTLGETVAFAMRSDLLKIDGGASDVHVLHNDLSRFRSQAIDMTQVDGVLIAENDFHDPIDEDAGATGSKFGSQNVTIRNNRVHDLGSDPRSHVFSLGGTGSEHDDAFTARAIHLEGNRVWNVAGLLAQLVSCVDCTVAENVLSNAGGGVVLSAAALGTSECTTSPSGCVASTGARITGNRMRDLNGGGDPAMANIFVWVDSGEGEGLLASNNVYCADDPQGARFGWQGDAVELAEFQSRSGTETNSHVLASGDPQCEF